MTKPTFPLSEHDSGISAQSISRGSVNGALGSRGAGSSSDESSVRFPSSSLGGNSKQRAVKQRVVAKVASNPAANTSYEEKLQSLTSNLKNQLDHQVKHKALLDRKRKETRVQTKPSAKQRSCSSSLDLSVLDSDSSDDETTNFLPKKKQGRNSSGFRESSYSRAEPANTIPASASLREGDACASTGLHSDPTSPCQPPSSRVGADIQFGDSSPSDRHTTDRRSTLYHGGPTAAVVPVSLSESSRSRFSAATAPGGRSLHCSTTRDSPRRLREASEGRKRKPIHRPLIGGRPQRTKKKKKKKRSNDQALDSSILDSNSSDEEAALSESAVVEEKKPLSNPVSKSRRVSLSPPPNQHVPTVSNGREMAEDIDDRSTGRRSIGRFSLRRAPKRSKPKTTQQIIPKGASRPPAKPNDQKLADCALPPAKKFVQRAVLDSDPAGMMAASDFSRSKNGSFSGVDVSNVPRTRHSFREDDRQPKRRRRGRPKQDDDAMEIVENTVVTNTNELQDGEQREVPSSSGGTTYTLSRHGNVYSCSCPAWKNDKAPAYKRSCKHLRSVLGDDEEDLRLETAVSTRRKRGKSRQQVDIAEKVTVGQMTIANQGMRIPKTTGFSSFGIKGLNGLLQEKILNLARPDNRQYKPDLNSSIGTNYGTQYYGYTMIMEDSGRSSGTMLLKSWLCKIMEEKNYTEERAMECINEVFSKLGKRFGNRNFRPPDRNLKKGQNNHVAVTTLAFVLKETFFGRLFLMECIDSCGDDRRGMWSNTLKKCTRSLEEAVFHETRVCYKSTYDAIHKKEGQYRFLTNEELMKGTPIAGILTKENCSLVPEYLPYASHPFAKLIIQYGVQLCTLDLIERSTVAEDERDSEWWFKLQEQAPLEFCNLYNNMLGFNEEGSDYNGNSSNGYRQSSDFSPLIKEALFCAYEDYFQEEVNDEAMVEQNRKWERERDRQDKSTGRPITAAKRAGRQRRNAKKKENRLKLVATAEKVYRQLRDQEMLDMTKENNRLHVLQQVLNFECQADGWVLKTAVKVLCQSNMLEHKGEKLTPQQALQIRCIADIGVSGQVDEANRIGYGLAQTLGKKKEELLDEGYQMIILCQFWDEDFEQRKFHSLLLEHEGQKMLDQSPLVNHYRTVEPMPCYGEKRNLADNGRVTMYLIWKPLD